MADMKCPDCIAAGTTSEVRTQGPRKSVKVPGAKEDKFWDEDGNFHDHRKISGWEQRYKCSENHHFTVVDSGLTCWCGYPTSGPYT